MNKNLSLQRRHILKLGTGLLAASFSPFILARTSSSKVQRLVILGGDIGEIVSALGGIQHKNYQIIATDITCTYPSALSALPKVGYMRTLSTEGLLSLKPNLILASSEAGPPYVLKKVREIGVNLVTLPEKHSIENVYEKIELVAQQLNLNEKKLLLLQNLQRDWQKTQSVVVNQPLRVQKRKPKILFLLNNSGSQALVAGSGTAADAMINYVGAENAVKFQQYKPMTAEAIIATAPDVILTVNESLKMMGGVEGLLTLPGFSQTPAARLKRLVAMDSLFLLGFGPRIANATSELHQRLIHVLS